MWEFFVQIVSQLTQFIFHAEVLISSSSETLENDLDFEGHDKDTAWGVVFGKLGVVCIIEIDIYCVTEIV